MLRSSSVSGLITFAGTPATSDPEGTLKPCLTSEPAATMEKGSITQSSSSTAPIPTST